MNRHKNTNYPNMKFQKKKKNTGYPKMKNITNDFINMTKYDTSSSHLNIIHLKALINL